MSFDYNSFDAFDKEFNRPQRPKIERAAPQSRKRITIYEYLASRVPSDAHYTINKFGKYRRARNERELEYQLKNGLKELANIHPDKDLLQIHCNKCSEIDRKNNDMSSLMEAQSKMMLNASGGNTPPATPPADNTDKIVGKVNANMLVMGGFVIMAVALIIKFKK